MGILDTPLSKKGILKALGQDPSKSDVLTVSTNSSGGVEIEGGSEARAFVTVGMEGGVPTGNFTQPSQAGSYP